MKKLFLFLILCILLTTTPAFALDLGKGFTLDGYWTAGKVYSVQKERDGNFETVAFTTEKGSYYTNGEVGVRYGIIRPFLGYESLTQNYDKKIVGADLFIYSIEGAAFGIRTQYTTEKHYGVGKQRFLYTGATVRF